MKPRCKFTHGNTSTSSRLTMDAARLEEIITRQERKANSQEANDWGVDRADLTEANMTKVWLMGAQVSYAKMVGCNLTGVRKKGVDFSNAKTSRAIEL